jgi:transcriptional regulator with XRE-family HTH domain
MTERSGKRRQQVLVGEKIREIRKTRGLTQADLATKVGVQQSDLCRMETGEYKVSLDTLFRILGVFEINIGEFFQVTGQTLEASEREVLRQWRQLGIRSRDEVAAFMRFKARQERKQGD